MNNPELAVNKTYDLGPMIDHLSKIEGNDVHLQDSEFTKGCLNQLFPGSKCVKVLYTNNTDKLFFGIKVVPLVHSPLPLVTPNMDITSFDFKVDTYAIELDSKLFDNMMGLTGEEITALIIYTVYYTLFDNTYKDIIFDIQRYEYDTGATIPIKVKNSLSSLLNFAMRATLTKNGSPFIRISAEDVADSAILREFNLSEPAYRGLKKIATTIDFVRYTEDPRPMAMSWVLRLLDNYEQFRTHAYKTLLRAADFTGSVLEREELVDAAEKLMKIDTVNEAYVEPPIRDISIKDLKNKLFELTVLFKDTNASGVTTDDVHKAFSETRSGIIQLQHYMATHRCDENMVNTLNDLLMEYYAMMDRLIYIKEHLDRGDRVIPLTFATE